eukprot:Skav227768  [mRNA]  locus=scaffold1237:9135:10327:+ [translate_table: standard]
MEDTADSESGLKEKELNLVDSEAATELLENEECDTKDDKTAGELGECIQTASPEKKKGGASQQKRRILRENLEETRQYTMSYDKTEKRLVVNERCNAFEHNIWDKDAKPRSLE